MFSTNPIYLSKVKFIDMLYLNRHNLAHHNPKSIRESPPTFSIFGLQINCPYLESYLRVRDCIIFTCGKLFVLFDIHSIQNIYFQIEDATIFFHMLLLSL